MLIFKTEQEKLDKIKECYQKMKIYEKENTAEWIHFFKEYQKLTTLEEFISIYKDKYDKKVLEELYFTYQQLGDE